LGGEGQKEVEVVRHHRKVHVPQGQDGLEGLLQSLLQMKTDHLIVYVRTRGELLCHEQNRRQPS